MAFASIIFQINVIGFIKANKRSLKVNIQCFVLVSLFAGLLCYPLHYYTVCNKYVCFSISLALPIIIVCLVVSFIVSCVCCLCCPCCCVYKRRSGGSEYFPCYMCMSVPVSGGICVAAWRSLVLLA